MLISVVTHWAPRRQRFRAFGTEPVPVGGIVDIPFFVHQPPTSVPPSTRGTRRAH